METTTANSDQAMTTKQARAKSVTSDPRWRAVRARDAGADGTFVYSVKTTGVYCYPSCGARAARPENVAFHASAAEAERAGFRACKRCKPDREPPAARRAAIVASLCRFIEASETPPSLAELARRAGLSAFHAHRMFTSVTGLTPRAYATAKRAGRLRAELGKRRTITEAIYGAGYNSNARFYASSNAILGMTPRRFRAGAPNIDITFGFGKSSLGSVLVAATDRGVCAISLGDDRAELERDLARRFPNANRIRGTVAFEKTVARVVSLVENPRASLGLPLDVRGTAFQQRVWQALRKIPAGKTVTYGDLARSIGSPAAARAVASACARNHISVAIPCHRAVREGGTLAGYYWGIERKRELLRREAGAPRRNE